MSACMPEELDTMVAEGFPVLKAYRQHLGLPIQYVAARSGIPVPRLAVLESGNAATEDEALALSKALHLPPGFLTGGKFDRVMNRHGFP